MDCVEGMKAIETDSVDLTVTSPPYDNLRQYNGYTFNWQETIRELYRITKAGGVVVWIVNDATVNGSETGTSFRQALFAKECGFRLHDTMIWKKESNAMPEDGRYYPVFEYMFIWSKGKPKSFNPIEDRINIYAGAAIRGTNRQADGTTKLKSGIGKTILEYGRRFNVWEINSEKRNVTGHPAVFPLQLATDHIRSWSNEGDLVLDPFLGSGTTRIAAHDLNRQFIGFEISEEYFKKQEKRFAEHTAQQNLFLME